MTIRIGDAIPDVTLRYLEGDRLETISTADLLAGRRVVLFAVPGAFTRTCHEIHLPGFVLGSGAIRAHGVDEIACVGFNDAFVMAAWGRASRVDGRVRLLADGNADLAAAMGIEVDASGVGMGVRGRRFAAVVEDGVVRYLGVEKGREIGVSSAASVLEFLAATDAPR
jgi:peroxiredoxin